MTRIIGLLADAIVIALMAKALIMLVLPFFTH
jgi:hypothetical protein